MSKKYVEGADARRPRMPPKPYGDEEVRRQCSWCCGLRLSGIVFCLVSFFTGPPILLEAYLKGKSVLPWTNLLNRWMMLPLPPTLISFTHHYLLSSALWSKNEKTVYEIQWETGCINVVLWYTITALSMLFSRNVLAKHSREYRVLLWDWKRQRRAAANAFFPPWTGKLTENLDFVLMFWAINTYHFTWAAIAWAQDREVKANYAFFYRQFAYSKTCAPRWREHRETEIKTLTETEIAPPKLRRWGNFFSIDEWRDTPG